MRHLMKTLIITEKPSVARDFAKALDIPFGTMENNNYVLASAIGHLVELFAPNDYDLKWKRWNLDNLPILPMEFKYKPISKTKKQLNNIVKQLKRRDIKRVIIATDAGREGEVIARTILEYGKNKKEIFRFWTSQALSKEVILESMRNIKPSTSFDRLYKAGQGRQFADWLVGMNLTRAATKKMGDLYSIGRVQTTVLSLLVDRRKEIDNFKPEPYWQLHVQFYNEKGNWRGTWFKAELNRFENQNKAEEIISQIDKSTGIVATVKKQKKSQNPPPLYSLTELQRDANKRYGFAAQTTLNLTQSLYEKRKCLSYPRSDSTVLGTKNVDMTKRIVDNLSKTYPDIFQGMDHNNLRKSNKRVFNDAKLTDHHALFPLKTAPHAVDPNERKIYDLVLRRFAAAFYPPCHFETTEIITKVNVETFRTKGKIILKPGWQVLYEREKTKKEDTQILPPLQKNDPAYIKDTCIEQKTTTPPAEYTESSLLGAMVRPAKYVSKQDLKNVFHGNVGLGTQATRAAIIEKLLERTYIERCKKALIATKKGCSLVKTLRTMDQTKLITSPEETARWEQYLEQIAQGKGDLSIFLQNIKRYVCCSIEEFKNNTTFVSTNSSVNASSELGKCPACRGNIIEGKKGFGCSKWKFGCKFVIWKQIASKKITETQVKQLVSNGKTDLLKGFKSKAGKPFNARLRLDTDNKVVFDFR